MPATIEIPVIDLSPFLAGAPEGAGAVRAIRDACEEIGFFCIVGHGVPDATIESIKERSRAFFDRDDAEKRRYATAGAVPGGVTYSPVASEALAASRGERTPGDLKQMLDYGPGWPGNPWPEEPAGLREAHEAYFDGARRARRAPAARVRARRGAPGRRLRARRSGTTFRRCA